MMRHEWMGAAALLVSAIVTVGCGGAEGGLASASPTGPSASASAATSINLAGSWTGSLREVGSQGGDPDSGPKVVWTATQSGTRVTGPTKLTFTEDDGSDTTISGTMAGTLSGSQMAVTFAVPAGSFANAPACAVSGTGASTPTATSIASTLTITFAPPCVGFVSERPTEMNELRLTKQ